MEIKDSGNRREFDTGAVRDIEEGKGRMDLLPWAAIIEVSKHCEAGAKKYGEHNVDKGIPTSSFCDSAARHLAKYLEGWNDEPHLLAATWNLLWALQMTIKNPEMVNTPYKGENQEKHNNYSSKKVKVYIEGNILYVEGYINHHFTAIDECKLYFWKCPNGLYKCDYSSSIELPKKYFLTQVFDSNNFVKLMLFEDGKFKRIKLIEIDLYEFCK